MQIEKLARAFCLLSADRFLKESKPEDQDEKLTCDCNWKNHDLMNSLAERKKSSRIRTILVLFLKMIIIRH